jgi:hypothetical protein
MRMTPNQYFGIDDDWGYTENTIPAWVPVLLGIAMIGCFAVALYAISRK